MGFGQRARVIKYFNADLFSGTHTVGFSQTPNKNNARNNVSEYILYIFAYLSNRF
jgi:hypothetical protein